MQRKLLLLSLVFINTLVSAADFKFGFVDANKILTTARPAIMLQQELKALYVPRQNQLQQMNNNLLNEQKQIQQIIGNDIQVNQLSIRQKNTLRQLEQKFQRDQQTFQVKYAQFQQSLQRAQTFASNAILNNANSILKDISQRDGYDLVSTSNQLVYAKQKYDLTNVLIVKLNQMNGNYLVQQLKQLDQQPLPAQNVNGSLEVPNGH